MLKRAICYNTFMQVKINIDGGSRGNPGPGAAAYVICAMDGKILAQEGHFMPHCTNNQAEYTALKLALIKAKELGATELFIQSDSQLLVKQYLGEYKIKHPDLASRMAVIRRLAAPLTLHIEHVLRHLNKAPDALANKAMDAKQSVGFNPIVHLPADEELSVPAPQGNVVNGVEVSPVVREKSPAKNAAKKPSKKLPQQPDLFSGF